MKTGFIILIGTLLLMGCANRAHFPAEAPSDKIIEYNKVFFFWGLFGTVNYELYEDCPATGVYEVYTYTSPSQIVLNIVTLGILSPRTIEITCSGQKKVDPFKNTDGIAENTGKQDSPLAKSENMKKDMAPSANKEPATSRAIFDDAKKPPQNANYSISEPSSTSKAIFDDAKKPPPTPSSPSPDSSQRPTIFDIN